MVIKKEKTTDMIILSGKNRIIIEGIIRRNPVSAFISGENPMSNHWKYPNRQNPVTRNRKITKNIRSCKIDPFIKLSLFKNTRK